MDVTRRIWRTAPRLASMRRRMSMAGTGEGVQIAALIIAAFAALPLVSIVVAAPAGGLDAIRHLASTVLPRYAFNTALLMALAGSLAAVIGTGCAWLVSATDFPGRRILSWALVLPLALPAYIAAYVYADMLDFTGPVQTGLRAATGWSAGEYGFPQVRSLGGGAFVLAMVLYPYVYLLARTAFAGQSRAQFQAARSLGARPATAFARVALPAARPAIAGGLALVLMEVLADFGVADYFAIPTFSTGIFRSWLAMGDKQAALKLAAAMLVFVIALVALEARTRKGRTHSHDAISDNGSGPLIELSPGGKALASLACILPLVLGFVLPALSLAAMAIDDRAIAAMRDLPSYAIDSLKLGSLTAFACCLAALALVFARSRTTNPLSRGAIRIATLGYALPGALLAVGLLAPLGVFDVALTRFARDQFGYGGGLLLGGTGAVLIYALSVRFLTVAYNAVDGGMAKVPPSLDAAARSLGAGPRRVLTKIYIPLLRPSLLAAAALVFIDTLRELPATLILRPFNLETLATRTYRLASDERLVEASIPALILLAAGLLPVLLLDRLGRR